MRTSLIITALMASVAVSVAGCDDQAGTAGKAAKTTKPGDKKAGGEKAGDKKVDKSKIKVHEEYLPAEQKQIDADNLDETVSKLEDDILTESKK
jgi:hypothetical protein